MEESERPLARENIRNVREEEVNGEAGPKKKSRIRGRDSWHKVLGAGGERQRRNPWAGVPEGLGLSRKKRLKFLYDWQGKTDRCGPETYKVCLFTGGGNSGGLQGENDLRPQSHP